MTRRGGARRAALLLVIWAAGGLAAAPREAVAAAGLAERVKADLDRYVAALEAADWETAVGFYARDPEFFWIEDGALRYRSQEEVAAAYAGLSGVFTRFEINIRDLRVVPLSAEAATVGLEFDQTMTTATGASVEIAGAILATMVLRGDGWKFLSGHTSTRSRPASGSVTE